MRHALLANMFMGDSYTNNQSGGGDFKNQRQNGRNNFRGGRGPNNREEAFRIRLSDNEIRQPDHYKKPLIFDLPISISGFAVRTLAQMLEDGSLENLVNQYGSSACQWPKKRQGNGAWQLQR